MEPLDRLLLFCYTCYDTVTNTDRYPGKFNQSESHRNNVTEKQHQYWFKPNQGLGFVLLIPRPTLGFICILDKIIIALYIPRTGVSLMDDWCSLAISIKVFCTTSYFCLEADLLPWHTGVRPDATAQSQPFYSVPSLENLQKTFPDSGSHSRKRRWCIIRGLTHPFVQGKHKQFLSKGSLY